jgi:hypothetical protein
MMSGSSLKIPEVFQNSLLPEKELELLFKK